ncbi:hypothetical protein FRC02_000783 [Tulasnella sp. 418]|nr:hypothetical protein FRC02_000783 [Tulasnella sp. 418]
MFTRLQHQVSAQICETYHSSVYNLVAVEMPPSSDSHTLNLHIVPRKFFVTQLAPSDPIPPSILERLVTGDDSCFISITRTSEEISIVLDGEIDSDWTNLKVTEWRCIKVEGPMDFGLTGIMNDLTLPLKVASISIFALSTWYIDPSADLREVLYVDSEPTFYIQEYRLGFDTRR